jgi:hypothetical protein
MFTEHARDDHTDLMVIALERSIACANEQRNKLCNRCATACATALNRRMLETNSQERKYSLFSGRIVLQPS